MLTASSVCAQFNHRMTVEESSYADPDGREIMAYRKKLVREEKGIADQQFILCEFEMRALKAKRNLEALALTPVDTFTPQQRELSTKMLGEINALDNHIAALKRALASGNWLLEETKRQLELREKRYPEWLNSAGYQQWVSDGNRFPNASRRREQDRKSHEHEVSFLAWDEREKQTAVKNLSLMQAELEDMRRSSQPQSQIPPLPMVSDFDMGELKLCEMLEKKASEKNCDIAELNLLAAKGLPGAENIDVEKTLKTLDQWAA